MPTYADPVDGLAVPVDLLLTWTAGLIESVGTPPDIAADVATVLVASDGRRPAGCLAKVQARS